MSELLGTTPSSLVSLAILFLGILGWVFNDWESRKARAESLAQQRKIAETELQVQENEKELIVLRRQQRWRVATPVFETTLKSGNPGRIEIFFDPEDEEPKYYAGTLYACLQASGWKVNHPEPIPTSKLDPIIQQIPINLLLFVPPKTTHLTNVSTQNGVVAIQLPLDMNFAKPPFDGDTAIDSLLRAFRADQLPAAQGRADLQEFPVPANTIRLVIGKRF